MDARLGKHEQDDDRSLLESQPESPTHHGSLSEITKVTSFNLVSPEEFESCTKEGCVNSHQGIQRDPIQRRRRTSTFRFMGVAEVRPKTNKGSPYPRGYYRCSSSKCCPAQKQVERSREDPTMFVVTYSCEHNQPQPAPKNNHHGHNNHNSAAAATTTSHEEEKPPKTVTCIRVPNLATELLPEGSGLGSRGRLDVADEFVWFMNMRTTPSTILKSPTFGKDHYHHHRSYIMKYERKTSIGDADVAMFFPMREEDASLFADLGELPECTVVFSPGETYNNNGVTQIC